MQLRQPWIPTQDRARELGRGQKMGFEMGGQTNGRGGEGVTSHAHVLTLTLKTTRERPVVICANERAASEGKFNPAVRTALPHSIRTAKNYPDTDYGASVGLMMGAISNIATESTDPI